METKELYNKAIRASENYLEGKGYEVLGIAEWATETGKKDVFIAFEKDTLVFVELNISNVEEGFSNNHIERSEFENLVARWLAENKYFGEVMMDQLDLMVVNEDGAMVRHHINAFGTK